MALDVLVGTPVQTMRFLMYATMAVYCYGQVRVTVTVPANRAWTRTGINLDRGSSVVIDATGQIDAVSDADTRALFHRVPPEGRAERQENKPQPSMRALVMLARIGDGPILEAGSHFEFTADRAGELQLGINDNVVDDNTGAWTAQVVVRAGVQSNTGRPQSSSNNTSDRRNQYPSADVDERDERTRRSASTQSRNRSDTPYPDETQSSRNSRHTGRTAERMRDEAIYALDDKAQEIGSRSLGRPTGDIRPTSDGRGWYREYRNTMIVWSPDTGAHSVSGDILQEWLNRGGAEGELGYPVADEESTRGGFRSSRFQRGTITQTDRGVRVQR